MENPSQEVRDGTNNFIKESMDKNNNVMNKSRPFICQVCTRAFIRQEHLKRHMRSHTNEKPFLCIFCGRCFARRDLVLRHQEKLHATLIGTSQHHYLLSKYHNDENIMDKIEPTRHVIKIEGNKQPILPTPANPTAQSQSQLRKAARLAEKEAKKIDKLQKRQAKLNGKRGKRKNQSQNVSNSNSNSNIKSIEYIDQSSNGESLDNGFVGSMSNNDLKKLQSQKRQRHASFSASSAFSYKAQNELPTGEQLQDDPALMSGIPHQVGFSTPQMTASDLVDKAHENGIENIPFFTLNTDDNKSTRNFKDIFFQNGASNKQSKEVEIYSDPAKGSCSKDQTKRSRDENLAAFDNVPFLADFLTMSSSAGGVGGFLNNQIKANNNVDNLNKNTKLNDSNNISSNPDIQINNLNFEINALNNLDHFQYDDKLLNFSTTDTETSSTSNISSRDESQIPIDNQVISSSTTPHVTQNQKADSTKSNLGLFQSNHTTQASSLVSENQDSNNAANNAQNLDISSTTAEKVLSKFITHAPVESDFLNHIDSQHFNDIGFANMHDHLYPMQSSEEAERASKNTSNISASLSKQSLFHFNNNSYTKSNTPSGYEPSPDLSNSLLSRLPSHHNTNVLNVIENDTSINQTFDKKVPVPLDYADVPLDQLGERNNNSVLNSLMEDKLKKNPIVQQPVSYLDSKQNIINRSNNHADKSNSNSIVSDSDDNRLTINFSPSYIPKQYQNFTPDQSNSQTPAKTRSRCISQSQSPDSSLQMFTTPANPKSQHTEVNLNHQPDFMNLFQSRQIDLYNNNHNFSNFANVLPLDNLRDSFPNEIIHYEKLISDINFNNKKYRVMLFSDKYRDEIIRLNSLKPNQLPTTQELNSYVNLYQDEFHKFFPFIHLHSITPTEENYPLLLCIAMIGALYSFHSIHSVLLSNLAWFQIKGLLEKQKNNYAVTPLWTIQAIILLTFVGIFSNDINVTKSMKIQLATIVELIKLTGLNKPLEHLVKPPIDSDRSLPYLDNPKALQELRDHYHSKDQLEKSFQYFIEAQTRIRTCHVALILSNFFTSLTGLESIFHSIDLKCGLPCYKEILYHSPNYQIWTQYLDRFNIELDSKFSLIELSNGNGTYESCLMYLCSGAEFYSMSSKISFKTLLSLLISIHEKISIERAVYREMIKGNQQLTERDSLFRWKNNSNPIISSMLIRWENLYMKAGGIFKPSHNNIETINAFPSLRLIIPLYHFAKVRQNIYIAPIMKKIWKHDWDGMNQRMSELCSEWGMLREACEHSFYIMEFWIDIVSILEFDPKQVTISTPVFSISCMVSSALILSEYLRVIESKSQVNKDGTISGTLDIADKMLWIKLYHLMERIDVHLKHKGFQLFSNLDLKVVDIENVPMAEIRRMIGTSNLSQNILHIGIDMLGTCPVWSVGVLFAQALQVRSFILKKGLA